VLGLDHHLEGDFDCVITNEAGSVITRAAHLAVGTASTRRPSDRFTPLTGTSRSDASRRYPAASCRPFRARGFFGGHYLGLTPQAKYLPRLRRWSCIAKSTTLGTAIPMR
jgi:hypothetical protein